MKFIYVLFTVDEVAALLSALEAVDMPIVPDEDVYVSALKRLQEAADAGPEGN